MVRSSAFVTSVGILCLTIAQAVSADPIQVTGTMNIIRDPIDGHVSLSGPSFAFDARVGWVEGYVGPFDCTPCTPGATINAGGVLSTTVFSAGSLTLSGVTYPVTGSIESPGTLYMELNGSVQAPPAGASTSVIVPFTMNSRVLINSQVLATPTLRGGGSATIFFTPWASSPQEPIWYTSRVQYDFTDTAPVPEPATLLLVGGGLAAAGALRRRRHCPDESHGTATL
jgi:hypothetical protein